jgi:serine/threonine protein kinase
MKSSLTAKHDIWTLGIVLYFITIGDFPFKGSDNNSLFKCIRTTEPNINGSLSQECQNLIQLMLHKDIKQRITAADALKHDWFKGDVDAKADLAQGGSNKSSVAANVSTACDSYKINKAIKAFHNRMCNSIDDLKKVQGTITDADKGIKLNEGILTNICKKMNEKVGKDIIEDLCDAFKDAHIPSDDLPSLIKLSFRDNNFAVVEFIFNHVNTTHGSVTADNLKTFLNEADSS